MKMEKVHTAAFAARAFLASTEKLTLLKKRDGELTPYVNSGKASSAVRRASMDLTRALAEMRKP